MFGDATNCEAAEPGILGSAFFLFVRSGNLLLFTGEDTRGAVCGLFSQGGFRMGFERVRAFLNESASLGGLTELRQTNAQSAFGFGDLPGLEGERRILDRFDGLAQEGSGYVQLPFGGQHFTQPYLGCDDAEMSRRKYFFANL